ncbi:bifunctional riboflavin kinase/FAD synthetase [Neisseria sp.]|uniref:bifunctional riboflavin kinase/FAD synthetase n=1 Tax=Neisseria sp. TaxID=192066 RepID=UPI00359F6B7A
MIIRFGQTDAPAFPDGAAVTVGNFDGVHLGHKHILQKLRAEAARRGLPVAVLVFEPQPQEFFARQNGRPQPYRLTPLRTKLKLLAATGCVDAVWVLRFNRPFAEMPADTFIGKLLCGALNTRYLLIGDDFRFGAARQGDFALLQSRSEFTVERTPTVMTDNIRTSSTAIRQALSDGHIDYARKLLGHPYSVSGRVVHGRQLGRTIGCPTANIRLSGHRYPLNGVFAVEAEGSFGIRRGAASFGTNPTVSDNGEQKLEVHLLEFSGDLYGQRLDVRFLHKLRDEAKFDSIEAMKTQIQADLAAARKWCG